VSSSSSAASHRLASSPPRCLEKQAGGCFGRPTVHTALRLEGARFLWSRATRCRHLRSSTHKGEPRCLRPNRMSLWGAKTPFTPLIPPVCRKNRVWPDALARRLRLCQRMDDAENSEVDCLDESMLGRQRTRSPSLRPHLRSQSDSTGSPSSISASSEACPPIQRLLQSGTDQSERRLG
jgi:hypothetical protein